MEKMENQNNNARKIDTGNAGTGRELKTRYLYNNFHYATVRQRVCWWNLL